MPPFNCIEGRSIFSNAPRVLLSVSIRGSGLFIAFAVAAAAQSPVITVVNSASYQPILAPDSLATIFGGNLASSTASATLDANGNLPTELANTLISVNGQPASLFYVSPTQINFVVPGGLTAGTAALTVSYSNSTATRTATVQIANTAPGLISSDASGHGPGAILNAVTFAGAPFLTSTTANGSTSPTRLAIYGTGVRKAQNRSAQAADSRGNRFDLTIEYAGAAPGFFGLDQINVVLPPGLDGGGAVSLTVTTDDAASNTVTAQIDQLPVSQLSPASVSLNPSVVQGGDPMTVTVTLNGLARGGGFPVVLRSTNPVAQPQAVVTIPEGSGTTQGQVATNSVLTVQTGSIQAIASGTTASADFEVDPANQVQITGFSVTPGSILGGHALTGVVNVTGTVPVGGVTIQISSDNGSVRPPDTVTVLFGKSSASFSITTSQVTGEMTANVTATLGRSSSSAKVKLEPPLLLTVDNASVVGGSNVTGTVTLGEAAPAGGATVNITSSDLGLVRPPITFTIPGGNTSNTFTATTTPQPTPRTANLTAAYQGVTQSVTVTVTPAPSAALDSVVVSPSTVSGGTSTSGLVTLTAPAGPGGFQVTLQSSLPTVAHPVPGFVNIPQGLSSGQFTITTTRIPTSQVVTITARSGSTTKTATLTVQ
jgi:uncharacterized protein (TIGR03437 family)